MFPNIRVMTVAMFASVFALSFGFGLFAEFRVNHEPLARPPVISGPVQPDGERIHAAHLTAADSPFAMRFQTPEPEREEISVTGPDAGIAGQNEPPHEESTAAAAVGAPEPESDPAPAVVGTLTAESPLQYAGLPNIPQCLDSPIAGSVEPSVASPMKTPDADADSERIAVAVEAPAPGQPGEQVHSEQSKPDVAPVAQTPPQENSAVAAVEPLIAAPALREPATMPEIKIGARQKPAAKPHRAAIARQRLAARTHRKFRPRRHIVARNVEQQPFNFGYPQLFQIGDQPVLNVQSDPQAPRRRVVLRRHRPAIQGKPQKTQQSAGGGPLVDP